MGTPVGSIWEVTLRTTASNQKCLNVLHYVVETETSTGGIAAESLQLANAIDAAGAIGPDFRDCLGSNVIHDEVVAQCIKDTLGTRYARQVLDVGDPGAFPAVSDTANIAATITKRTSFSGRWAVGSFHVPGVPIGTYAAGKFTDAPYIAAVNVLAAELLQSVTTAGGGVYQPVIYHPDGLHDGYTRLQDAERQEEVRTMRRRTVGRGI